MVLRVITYFLALTISFVLFYFNVPYWTGRDMADLSSSGIWRAFFRFLSFLGYGLYRLCELVCRGIQRPVLNVVKSRNPRVLSTIAKLVNILFYIGVMYVLTLAYGNFMDGMFPPIVQTVGDGSGGTVYGLLSEIVVVLRVFATDVAPQDLTFGGIVAGVAVFIVATALYVAVNTLFFSILYGLLRNKLREVNLTKRIAFLAKEGAPETEDGPAVKQLGKQLVDSVKEFLNKQTQINSLNKNPVLLILLLLVFLFFSVFMTWMGKDDLRLSDVAWQIIDQIQIIPIVVSFVITYWIDRGVVKTGQIAVAHMPEGVQQAVHAASARGNLWADAQDSKRAEWAAAHDVDDSEPDEPMEEPSAPPEPQSPSPAEAPAAPPVKTPPIDIDTSEQCPYREYCPMCGKADQFGEEVLCQDTRYKNCEYYKSIKDAE